jgi:outer membrane protein OmpA-like peptidoglycan-associated protein
MNANLLSLVQNALGGDFSKMAGQFVSESPTAIQGALNSLLPGVLGAIAQKGATADGASGLLSLINGANLDTSSLSSIGSLFSGGGAGANDLLKAGASRLVPALLGDKAGALVNALSSSSGIKPASATNLLALVVPLVLTFLKKFVTERGLNPNSLSSLLGSQGPNLQGALDSRITNALGFTSPSALVNSLSGAAGATVDTARRAGAAVASGAAAAGSAALTAGSMAEDEGKSALARLLPWVIGLAALFLLWLLLWPKAATTPPPQAMAPAAAPAIAMPAQAFSGFPAKVYFDTGSATPSAGGTSVINGAADAIKKENLKVAVTGYTDKTGDTAKNEELAKNRATAVRDALKAAGVADANIDLKPPLFVEVGASTDSAEARRVEINKQ